MKELSIIPCGRKKIWDKQPELGPVAAKDAYIGTLHQRTREYAQLFTNQWVILSAKHGFLFAEDEVDGQYDVTFNRKNDEIITFDKLIRQMKNKQLDQFDKLVVLTGKKYKPIINGTFPDDMPKTYPLLQFGGIGYILQALKQSTEANQPIHK
ncbi:DUF6884 domain-containing protein [Lentibacillus amyloliquefaciens]|uniref:DUF6884 domain-containing protein n=1 Tax=Lentibacillus amyloliquefaciens TaxID=1472767 RepID=A0A0U3NKI7_9BACI|nr:DUF6884 domain-containing protein [Lentibacillus amyloliquefaciens]ALX47291.1 hypothetical protein AOX59_00960 [Lentibacillus amyloliquefaciens]